MLTHALKVRKGTSNDSDRLKTTVVNAKIGPVEPMTHCSEGQENWVWMFAVPLSTWVVVESVCCRDLLWACHRGEHTWFQPMQSPWSSRSHRCCSQWPSRTRLQTWEWGQSLKWTEGKWRRPSFDWSCTSRCASGFQRWSWCRGRCHGPTCSPFQAWSFLHLQPRNRSIPHGGNWCHRSCTSLLENTVEDRKEEKCFVRREATTRNEAF